MLIDHIGSVFFPNVLWLRFIGRIAFVLYAFMIAEGVKHTRNIKLYLSKLFGLACVSEIPYNLLFYNRVLYYPEQNVVFTLLISALSCAIIKNHSLKYREAWVFALYLPLLSGIIQSDYGTLGSILIILFFLQKSKESLVLLIFVFTIFQAVKFRQFTYLGSIFAIPFLWNYQYRKNKSFSKLYWAFYPLHLILLFGMKLFLN